MESQSPDRINMWVWRMLAIVGAAVSLIALYRYFLQ
jgi:hypothetical protein